MIADGPDRGQQLDRREVGRIEVDRAHVRYTVLLVEDRHPVDVLALAPEGAHDADARQRLLEIGGDVGDPLPRQPVGVGGDDPEDDARDRQHREGEEGDQGELEVERDEDRDHAAEGQHAREQGDHAVGDQAVERLHVVGHARDQHPGLATGEEPDRHRLQMAVDALAQVLQRALSDPADQVGLGVRGAPVDRDRGDEDDDDDRQRSLVARLDPVVDRPPREVGRGKRRRGRDQQRHHHQDHLRPVGPQQAEQPADLARPLVLAAKQAPQVSEHQHRARQASRLVRLVLGLLGDVGVLRLGIPLGDGSTSRSRRGSCGLPTCGLPTS